MIYPPEYTKRACIDLKKLDKGPAQRVIRSLRTIKENPYHYIKKLKGARPELPLYTFHIGLYYRAILSIYDSVLIIHVLEIEDRRQSNQDF